MHIEFRRGGLTTSENIIVAKGFDAHSKEQRAPPYSKEHISWLVRDERDEIAAVLTANILWDWMYVDELWVSSELRGGGHGTKLILLAEEFASSRDQQGIWLWTQSWQAEQFYSRLDYSEFARFENFPTGHTRIGFRKSLSLE